MGEAKFEGQEAADNAFRVNCSPRYVAIDALESYSEGTQYNGLPEWWDDKQPLWERAPCIVYPVVSIARDSYIDLLLGQGRYPEFATVTAEAEDASEDGDDGALGKEDAAGLDRFIGEWHRASRFRSLTREAVGHAMVCRSAAVIHGVRNGRPFADLVPAKWSEPKIDQDGVTVLSLEIRYPYQEQYKDPKTGKWHVRTRLYRRTIDAKSDTEYEPAEANELGAEPTEWTVNKARTVEHGLGFCPVIWYPFFRGCVPVNVIDGKAIHETITDEIRQHDLARSQWHRGALLSEPQPYEIGVSPGYNPTESGVLPRVVSTERGGPVTPGNPITGAFVDAGGPQKSARKRGPGYIWQYPAGVEVGTIVYPAEALKAQEDNCRDLRLKLQEALSVVFLDPESIKFAATTSGKALEAIKQKQLDRCDKIRDDVVERYLEPSIAMQLRIAESVLAKGQALRLRGAKKIGALLKRFNKLNIDGLAIPNLQTRWGDYFKPDVAEQRILVGLVIEALNSSMPVVTVKAAVSKLAPIFGITNVPAFLEEIESERKRRTEEKQATGSSEIREALKQLGAGSRSGAGVPAEGEPTGGPQRTGDAAPTSVV